MHGWQFDVATGECLTSKGLRLHTRRIEGNAPCHAPCQGPEKPELAVIVLALGAPPVLRAAVESLLGQPVPLEIVVVNSGGGDAGAVLSGLDSEVRIISATERLWPGAARNVGIRATQAPWIAFLASDHIAAPDWAEHRLARHRAGHRAVASAVVNSHPRNPYAWTSHVALLVRRLPGVPPEEAGLYGVSYARALFDRHGPFREDLRIGEDTEFNARLPDADQPVWAPEIRVIHRNPTRFVRLIGDQYARGRRNALHWPRRLKSRLPRRAVTRFRWTVGIASRSVHGRERVMLFFCLPLLFIAVLAHEFGVRAGVRERSAPAADAAATPQKRPDASLPR